MNRENETGNPRPRIDRPVVVEGRYDKAKLASLFEADIITTEGFGIFKNREKLSLLRRLASAGKGIILLTDSDGAGLVIRNYLRGCLGTDCRVIQLYIPPIPGKERRKTAPSAEGLLGVEGVDAGTLAELFEPYLVSSEDGKNGDFDVPDRLTAPSEPVTKSELYADGLSGGESSAGRRRALCRALNLPQNLSANALLEAVNMLGGKDLYREMLKTIDKQA